MTGGRMILAGLLGGLALFIWGFLAHAVFSLGHMGVASLPSGEAEIASLLKQHAPKHGIYLVPGPDMERMGDEAYQDELGERMRAGPFAWMVVKADGVESMTPQTFMNEYATSVGLALIATFLIVAAGGLSGLPARIVFCVLLALFGLFQTEVRHWNWYAFPGEYTTAQFIDRCIGGALLGLVIHFCVRRR